MAPLAAPPRSVVRVWDDESEQLDALIEIEHAFRYVVPGKELFVPAQCLTLLSPGFRPAPAAVRSK